jgi:hypothetical protein
MSPPSGLRLPARVRAPLWLAVAGGAGAAVVGVRLAPERVWPTLLLHGFYALGLALSALFFLSTQRLAGARWSAGLRRIPEALLPALLPGSALMLAVFAGRVMLYPWSRPGFFAHDAPAGRAIYLRTPFVGVRLALVLVVWGVFAWLIRRASLAQHHEPYTALRARQREGRLSAAFLVAFAFSFTVGAYDWLLSLDPHWSSTMFAVYVFAGTVVQGLAAITLATVVLRDRGLLAEQTAPGQLHDLGKMLFAFSTFWAYIWTCQYLLVWYGNIPDEVSHYLTRTRAPWLGLFALNLVVNWALPFAVLLSAGAKRRPTVLKAVSVLLLLGHGLDLTLLVMPEVSARPRFGLPELLIALGSASLLILLFARSLGRAPLVPAREAGLRAPAQAKSAVEVA